MPALAIQGVWYEQTPTGKVRGLLRPDDKRGPMLRALQHVLERWLAIDWFSGIVVPTALVGVTIVAKCLASPRRFELEDVNVGTDLLLTAVGSQLGTMALLMEEKLEPLRIVQAQLDLGFAVLLLLAWLLGAFILYMRAWGYDDTSLKVFPGVIFPIGFGMVALIAVYGVNAPLWGA